MNTVFTVTLESTYKQNSTYPKRNIEKLIEKKYLSKHSFFVDKKAFNKTDVLMRNNNPSPFEVYFPCEKTQIS